jgi:ElaB/YqjD/DUF883 family membrane-anchored ribosome-binding protein
MPQRLYSSSDVPDYGTYPESPGEVTSSEGIRARSNAPLVEDSGSRADGGKVAQLRDKAADVLDQAASRARDLKDEAIDRAAEMKDQAMATGGRWMESARDRASDLGRDIRGYSRVAVRDYPIHVIVGAAAIGLLLGIGLRVWRENRV